MNADALIELIPQEVLTWIYDVADNPHDMKYPARKMMKRNGYKKSTIGLEKLVYIHRTHVLKFGAEEELETYDLLDQEQRQLIVFMVEVTYGISVVEKAMVLPASSLYSERDLWYDITQMVNKVAIELDIIWDDDQNENIGFVPRVAYPVIIDLGMMTVS